MSKWEGYKVGWGCRFGCGGLSVEGNARFGDGKGKNGNWR